LLSQSFTFSRGGIFVQKASLASLPDVLDARDIASVLGIGYVKALRLIRYGDMNYIRIGCAYRVSKDNFINWLNCSQPTEIELD